MVFEHGQSLPHSGKPVKKGRGITDSSTQVKTAPDAPNRLIGKDPFRSGQRENPRQIGYIRVSTRAQITDRQTLQLEAECDALHVEYVSAVAADRPVFEAVLADLQAGDTFIVQDLDRAFRSSIDAMLTAEALRQRGVNFRILSLNVDTRTPEGELFYTLVASFAQYERRIISRRTSEGLSAARKRGVRLGRPTHLAPDTIREAYEWMTETGLPCRYVAALLGVSRLTLQRGFHRLGLTYPIPF